MHTHPGQGRTCSGAQDDLIERLGGIDAVAELTGRRKRMVRDRASGRYVYRARARDCPVDQVPQQRPMLPFTAPFGRHAWVTALHTSALQCALRHRFFMRMPLTDTLHARTHACRRRQGFGAAVARERGWVASRLHAGSAAKS